MTALLFHVATAGVFFWVARRLLCLAMGRGADGSGVGLATAAGLAAVLFAIHPLRVESVAWATERRDLTSGLFLLITLAAYVGALNLAALGVSGIDKVLHFFMVGALAFFSVGWWADRPPWMVLVALAIVSIVDEAGQTFSAARSFSLLDLAANWAGILVFGSLAGVLVHKGKRAVHRRRAA